MDSMRADSALKDVSPKCMTFMECSSRANKNVQELFDVAVRLHIMGDGDSIGTPDKVK